MRAWLCGLVCLVPALAAAQGPSAPAESAVAAAVFSGVDRQLQVQPPRIEAEVQIDGQLDEAVWAQAARLTGFSRYAPVDGGPADRATEVLVWYSPSALHFGVRAQAAPGGVQATLADRDRIDADDHVQFFLSTFGDGRQAFVFAVNPFGVQMDGAMVEGVRSAGGGFGGLSQGREDVDRSPDFVFQSRGRLEGDGYVVEVRIPFKSLRYQASADVSWGLHVTRVSPRAGVEESWAPARRDGASFLNQAGALVGMHDLRRGLVLDLESHRHRSGERRTGGRPVELRLVAAGHRHERALGRHRHTHAQRHGQSRLLAGRSRRRTVPVRPAPGALLPRQAAVLPRRHRAVRHAQQPDLHPPRRGAAGRHAAHRTRVEIHEYGLPDGGRRPRHLDHRPRSPGVQHPAGAARHRRRVESRPRLHRPHRRRALEPGVRRRHAAGVEETSTACCCKARRAAPTRAPPR